MPVLIADLVEPVLVIQSIYDPPPVLPDSRYLLLVFDRQSVSFKALPIYSIRRGLSLELLKQCRLYAHQVIFARRRLGCDFRNVFIVAACKTTVAVHAFIDSCSKSRACRDRYVTNPAGARGVGRWGKWTALRPNLDRLQFRWPRASAFQHNPNPTLAVVFAIVFWQGLQTLTTLALFT